MRQAGDEVNPIFPIPTAPRVAEPVAFPSPDALDPGSSTAPKHTASHSTQPSLRAVYLLWIQPPDRNRASVLPKAHTKLNDTFNNITLKSNNRIQSNPHKWHTQCRGQIVPIIELCQLLNVVVFCFHLVAESHRKAYFNFLLLSSNKWQAFTVFSHQYCKLIQSTLDKWDAQRSIPTVPYNQVPRITRWDIKFFWQTFFIANNSAKYITLVPMGPEISMNTNV